MTPDQLDELERRIENKVDSFETSVTLGLDEAKFLLSLARIGEAAVEGRKYGKKHGVTEKLGDLLRVELELIDAYLASRKGEK